MLATAGTLGTITRMPYERLTGLDGYKYIIDCDTVHAIDKFFMTECSREMTLTDVSYAVDLITYEDTGYGREDIIALDAMFSMMVTTGKDCTTLQGEISGC